MPYGLARFRRRRAAVVDNVSEKPFDFSMAFNSLSVSMSFAIMASFSMDSLPGAVTSVGTAALAEPIPALLKSDDETAPLDAAGWEVSVALLSAAAGGFVIVTVRLGCCARAPNVDVDGAAAAAGFGIVSPKMDVSDDTPEEAVAELDEPAAPAVVFEALPNG